MKDDPIIEELYQMREAYAKRFDYNIAAMAEHIRKREKEHPERMVVIPPRPLQKRAVALENADDYGKR